MKDNLNEKITDNEMGDIEIQFIQWIGLWPSERESEREANVLKEPWVKGHVHKYHIIHTQSHMLKAVHHMNSPWFLWAHWPTQPHHTHTHTSHQQHIALHQSRSRDVF